MNIESLRTTIHKSREILTTAGSSTRALGESLKRFGQEAGNAASAISNSLRTFTRTEVLALTALSATFIIPPAIENIVPNNYERTSTPSGTATPIKTPDSDTATITPIDATPVVTSTIPELRVTITGSNITPAANQDTRPTKTPIPTLAPEQYDPACGTGVIDGVRYVTPNRTGGVFCDPNNDYNTLMQSATYVEPTDFDHFAGITDRRAGDYYKWVMKLPDGRIVSISAPTPTLGIISSSP